MNIAFYPLSNGSYKSFDILPVITIGYEKYGTKYKFSIYFCWLFWGFEIYQE